MDITTAYHVTHSASWPRIQAEGLLPTIGDRSADLGEVEARIYLFPDKDSMNNALMNWLGECFEEEENLYVLEVDITDYETAQDVEWEITISHPIPASRISHVGMA